MPQTQRPAAQIANRAEANDNEALVSFGTSTWDSSPSEESAAEDLLLDEDESEFAWDEVGSTQINADSALETQLPDTAPMFDLDWKAHPKSCCWTRMSRNLPGMKLAQLKSCR
jgi:hypothetical protein